MSLLHNPSRDGGAAGALGLLMRPAFWLSAIVILHHLLATHWFSREWETLRHAVLTLAQPLLRRFL